MTSILDIQKLDGEKRKLQAEIDRSKENKLLAQFTSVMKEGRSFINNIANASSEMINEYNKIKTKYENSLSKAEIVAKQKVEKSSLENIESFLNDTNSLASELSGLEQKMKELSEKSSKLLNDYNVAMNQLKNTKQKVDTLKEMLQKMQDNLKPKFQEIDKKIKDLETDVDPEIYKEYKKMRDDNIFPVFVKLNGNRCGGCQMELPLSFIDKLKLKGHLACEECHRIIIFKE